MPRRREPVPFAFVAEADRFRSNVTPPPREAPGRTQRAARGLVGLALAAGLLASLLLGVEALRPEHASATSQQSGSSAGR
ncbi:hypothetical protein [Streptomyces sp. 2P-4]|uniref:hypothetical protein n=1 Tax=Streptomyces sp. 2P-4 TaxID=2931974 RepID=UPI00254118DB|nr:hypothetical protein [Streptomyces sp. 2P-4]